MSRADQAASPIPLNNLHIGDFQATVLDGPFNSLDVSISLLDDTGDTVTGAQVFGSARDPYSGTWEGYLVDEGGGFYKICQVGQFYFFCCQDVGVHIFANKPGYVGDSLLDYAVEGGICAPTSTPTGIWSTPTQTRTPTPTATVCSADVHYVITQSSGATIVPGTHKLGGGQPFSDLPFPVRIYDVTARRAIVSRYGNLQLYGNLLGYVDSCLPLPAPFRYTIFAQNDDLSVDWDISQIYTAVTGVAPNRMFYVEWRTAYADGTGTANFEVRLYENQNKFDIIYGVISRGGANAQVGVQRGYGNGANFTQYACHNAGLYPGLMLTFTQAPCGTPTPEPVLTGHVIWQARPAQPDPQQRQPVTLTLSLAGGADYRDYPVRNTNASGYFTASLAGLIPGTYNWRVKGPKYLARAGTLFYWASSVSQDMGFLQIGDCNNDNVVNSVDFALLDASFGRSAGEPGYDARADLTGDDTVNALDFVLLKSNFGMGGAPPP